MRTLLAGGAKVALCSANPLATQDDVAAALVVNHGAEVRAVRGEDAAAYAENLAALVARGPQVTVDDGADLISTIHAARPELLDDLLGGTEETTTGLVRLRAMEAEGRLGCPVIAVNEARTERAFNDRYGTGPVHASTASCAPPTCCSPAARWSSSATAGPARASRCAHTARAPR